MKFFLWLKSPDINTGIYFVDTAQAPHRQNKKALIGKRKKSKWAAVYPTSRRKWFLFLRIIREVCNISTLPPMQVHIFYNHGLSSSYATLRWLHFPTAFSPQHPEQYRSPTQQQREIRKPSTQSTNGSPITRFETPSGIPGLTYDQAGRPV